MAPGTRVACSLSYGPDGSRASSFVLAPLAALAPASRAGYHPPLAKPLDLLPPPLSRRPPLSLTLPNASRGTLSLPLSLPPHHHTYSNPVSVPRPPVVQFLRPSPAHYSITFLSPSGERVVALSRRSPLFSPIPSAGGFCFFPIALSPIFDRSARAWNWFLVVFVVTVREEGGSDLNVCV